MRSGPIIVGRGIMKLNILRFDFRQDLDRLKVLHWGLFLSMALSLVFRWKAELTTVHLLLHAAPLLLIFRFFYWSARELYYSFWFLAFILFCYMAFNLFRGPFESFNFTIKFFNLLGLVILSVEAYLLSSPIYYPRVNWWEYDFRFRPDMKITVHNQADEPWEGRLCDVRRQAGCVILFKNLKIGDQIEINAAGIYRDLKLNGQIVSKREYLVGRGITYGVKFNFNSYNDQENFGRLYELWKNQRKLKAMQKFNQD